MIFLKKYWVQILTLTITCAIAVLSFNAGCNTSDKNWQLKWNKEQKAIAANNLAHEKKVRNLQTELQKTANEVDINASKKITALESDIAIRDSAADGLRGEIKRYQARINKLTSNSPAAINSATTDSASNLLAELYNESIKRNEGLAEAADRSRIAGLACEAAYDGLVEKFNTDNVVDKPIN